MVFFSLFFLLMTSSTFAANQVTARIHSIDRGQMGEENLFLLTSGDVVTTSEKKMLENLEQAFNDKSLLHFSIGQSRKIESVHKVRSQKKTEIKLYSFPAQEIYEPTIVENLELAKSYFTEAKRITRESECFNRAHVWSYEWFVNSGINSNKTWIFFTRQYIRKFQFKWWFHVAPSMQVMENGFPREKVFDVKYSRGPIDIKSWSDIFMRNKASCPLVTIYSDYANYPESASCYIMNTSMFYYQPFDIESRETWGTIKANWYDPDIQQAYADAFDEVQ